MLLVRVGALTFAVIVLFLHWRRGDVDPLRRGISHYADGGYGWLMTCGFLALATALAIAASTETGTRSGWLWIASAGIAGVAITPITVASSTATRVVHQAAGCVFFVAIFAAAVTKWVAWADVALALAVVLFLASFALVRAAPIRGALQRLVFAIVVIWLVR